MNPNIVVVSSSLATKSRTRIGAQLAMSQLQTHGANAHLIDLHTMDLRPYPRSENDDALKAAVATFNGAHGWLLTAPIYNFGASGALLDFLHYALDSDLGKWKPCCVLASMGGARSQMAADHVLRSMIYEVSAVPVGPPLVNIGNNSINRDTGDVDPDFAARMNAQLGVLVHYARARLGMPA